MTATEHAEAILNAIGYKEYPLIVERLVPLMLAAVEATMQDAKAEALGDAATVARDWGNSEFDESSTVMAFAIADDIEALAHKGAGDE